VVGEGRGGGGGRGGHVDLAGGRLPVVGDLRRTRPAAAAGGVRLRD
jgi:hypothetical protein